MGGLFRAALFFESRCAEFARETATRFLKRVE
jgi:hypothetical protein